MVEMFVRNETIIALDAFHSVAHAVERIGYDAFLVAFKKKRRMT